MSHNGLADDKEHFTRWLFAQECHFVIGVPDLKVLPAPTFPEVAFVGRSNVGKSSLINAITRRKDLARTSHTPGRTQQLNFFNLANKIHIVDLPGYGYAQAPHQLVIAWTNLIINYLKGRALLKRVYLLIDSRHGIKVKDKEMMAILDEAAVVYQIVLTKIDKISNDDHIDLLSKLELTIKNHPACFPIILSTSSEKKMGIFELQTSIVELITG